MITALVLSSFIIGCGDGSTSSSGSSESSGSSTTTTTSSATILDSKITGLNYLTNSGIAGVTKDGQFYYTSNDKNITFEFGGLKLATFDLANLNPDNLVLISDLFGLDRNNTTAPQLLKTIDFLQSLDTDNNPSNGIDMNVTEAQAISINRCKFIY